MNDFFEIDFLDVESDKSGDAICIRYSVGGSSYIHVVDGGFQATGESVRNHINQYYGNPRYLDNVVLTHSDSDHAGGLRTILEEFDVGTLWMLRPWTYASEILHRFPSVSSVQYLERLLREAYPNVVALEEIAIRRGIPIAEPFQGTSIGAFSVLAPSKARYLELLVRSDCTPKSEPKSASFQLESLMRRAVAYAVRLVKALWGDEKFSPEAVSAENEMSVVQYGKLNEKKILLTADAGREGLSEVVSFAPMVGLELPGVDRFQVPHHGSRRNVSTDLLDQILGPRLQAPVAQGQERFVAIISSAKKDTAHPRKAVVRAMHHRGASVVSTEGKTLNTQVNAPSRGWVAASPIPYPEEQEE